MLLRSITVCCLMFSVQTQKLTPNTQSYASQSPYYLSDQIYFDNRPLGLPIDYSKLQAVPVRPLKADALYETEKSNEVSKTSPQETPKQGNSQAAQAIGGHIRVAANVEETQKNELTQTPSGGSNKLLNSVTSMGLNLLRDIKVPFNVVVSPYSITAVLALLQQGCSGQTQQQIVAVLGMTPPESASSYSAISQEFKQRNSRNILKTASNVFVAETFSINPDFKKIALGNFDSSVTPVSFGSPVIAAKKINTWVASQTNDKIDRLVTPESVDSSTQMVLVNAVYFKGLWEIPFRVQNTIPREFHYSNGAKKMVPYMNTRRLLRFGTDPTTNAKTVILPFENAQYSLMVIVPSSLLGISGTLEHLNNAKLFSYRDYQPVEISLYIPKFTVKADTDLIQVLRKMGLTDMFGPNADLTKIGTYKAYSPQVSSAVHSAVLSIDEQGGSAAAATSFAAVALSNDEPTVILRVNKPFMAILWDEKTSLPLFMAKIEDPTQV